MADRLEWFDLTIPAGTAITAPVTLPMVFQQGIVTQIDVKVLDGPCGSVGFHINAGGSQYVPRTLGSFIRPNDDYFAWPLEHAITSGSWALTGYNLDNWDHNIQVGFQVNETGTAGAVATQGIGQSSAAFLTAGTQVQPSPVPVPDPLSPDSLIASVSSDVLSFLASQQEPSPEIAGLTSAGTP